MAHTANKVVITYVLLTVVYILLQYVLSVAIGHVGALVPYLGFIGDLPPESTVYTQCVVIVAAVFMFVIQVQYVYVSSCLSKTGASRESVAINTAGVCIGYVAAAGLFVVACFQESHAFYVHHVGEVVYLLGSTLYFSCQTALARTQNEEARLRLALNLLMGVCFLVFMVGYVLAVKWFKKDWEQRYFWERDDGGWIPHLLSATAEWILICLFQVYLLTFSKGFRRVLLTKTRIIVLPPEEERINQRQVALAGVTPEKTPSAKRRRLLLRTTEDLLLFAISVRDGERPLNRDLNGEQRGELELDLYALRCSPCSGF